MDYLFCGIDISKDHLDFALCTSGNKEVIDNGQVSNDRSGIEKLFNILLELRDRREVWVCFEHTGHYGALLAHLLHEHDLRFSSVPSLEIINSSGMTRGSTTGRNARSLSLSKGHEGRGSSLTLSNAVAKNGRASRANNVGGMIGATRGLVRQRSSPSIHFSQRILLALLVFSKEQ